MALGITVSWNKNTDNSTSEYGIWRRVRGEEAQEIARVPHSDGEKPSYVDSDVEVGPPPELYDLTIIRLNSGLVQLGWKKSPYSGGPVYYYSIRSYDLEGNPSPFCPEISLQAPNAISHYEWSLFDEEGCKVDGGEVPGRETKTPGVGVVEGERYFFRITATNQKDTPGAVHESEIFTA